MGQVGFGMRHEAVAIRIPFDRNGDFVALEGLSAWQSLESAAGRLK